MPETTRWWQYIVLRGDGIPAELDGMWFDLETVPQDTLSRLGGDAATFEPTNRWEQREDGAVAVVYEWRRRPMFDLADLIRRPTVDVCPVCKSILAPGMCCFTYTTWHCWVCGSNIDSRVTMPLTGFQCEQEWSAEERLLGEPLHPRECACMGAGYFLVL